MGIKCTAGMVAMGAALVMAAPAHAATVTQTFSYGPLGLFLPPIASPTFNQFNPLLGTLTGVTFSLSAITSGYYQAENLDSPGIQVSLQAAGVVTLQGVGLPSGSPYFQVITAVPGVSANLSAFDGNFDFGGTSGFTSGTLTSPQATVQYAIANAFYGSFTGAGTYTGTLTGHHEVTGTSARNLDAGASLSTSTSVTLTYTYTPFATAGVPEPGTWAMLIVGFGLTGGALRRRRSVRVTLRTA